MNFNTFDSFRQSYLRNTLSALFLKTKFETHFSFNVSRIIVSNLCALSACSVGGVCQKGDKPIVTKNTERGNCLVMNARSERLVPVWLLSNKSNEQAETTWPTSKYLPLSEHVI